MKKVLYVMTSGCFDILHVGHIRFLNACKKLGCTLTVALNSDESIKQLKGEYRPINNEQERREMLLALKAVDDVVIFNEDTPINLLNLYRPPIYVKSSEYKNIDLPEFEFVRSYGGEVVFIDPDPETANIKTTKKIDEIFNRELQRRLGNVSDSWRFHN